MKVIGLLCGLSWLSTNTYYQTINRKISQIMGDGSSAHLMMNSLNGQAIAALFRSGQYDLVKKMLIAECLKLERAGCDFIGIACNTLHFYYQDIQNHLNIPIIHIMDCLSQSLFFHKKKHVGLLGTEYTVKNGLYEHYLGKYDIDISYPKDDEIFIIDTLIQKTCNGLRLDENEKNMIDQICNNLKLRKVDALVLGCTELGLLVRGSPDVEIFDSAVIHSESLANLALDFDVHEKIPNCLTKEIEFVL